jgi:hypothetical protein
MLITLLTTAMMKAMMKTKATKMKEVMLITRNELYETHQKFQLL